MKKIVIASAITLQLAFAASAQTAFAPGQLAVLRAGNGTVDLAGKQAPVFIDQFDPNNTGNTNVYGPQLTVAIPTTGDYSTPAKSPLFINGQAATEGGMSRSADRTVLTWAGYANPPVPFAGTPSSAPYNRGFCTIDAFTNYNMPYYGQDWYGGATLKTNPRGIATDGTNQFWGSGGTDGNEYWSPAIPNEDPFQFQSIADSTRSVKIINNTVFTAINSADAIPYYPAGIYSFIDDSQNPFPLPNASAGLQLVIPVVAPYTLINGFDINPQETVAYVADTGNTSTDPGGVQKYVKSGGSWNFAYNIAIPQNIPANLNNLSGCFDLVVDWSGANPVIYATTTEGYGGNVDSNRVVQIVDTGSSATVTTVVQSPSIQEVYRGIAFTPDLRPVISSEPVSYSTVVGSNVTFSVAASSVTNLFYQWYTNGVAITDTGEFTGTATNLLTVSNVQLSDAVAYSVVVSNIYGSVTSAPPASLIVSLSPLPPVFGPEQFLTNLIGDNITIPANVSGTDPKSYQWYSNGVAITDGNEFSGTASASLNINNAQINDATVYSVAVSNPSGTPVTNVVAQVTLQFPVPAIIAQPVSTTALQGAFGSFNVKGYGSSLSYQWYSTVPSIMNTTNFSYVLVANAIVTVTNVTSVTNTIVTQLTDGVGDITGSATSTLQFTNVALADANTNGGYYAIIYNAGGTNTTQSATLTVLPQQAPSVVNYASAGQVYLQNFDSLPIPLGATVNTANPLTVTVATNLITLPKTAQVNIYSLGDAQGGTYYDFAAPIIPKGQVGGLGLAGTMDGWYGWAGTGIKFGLSAGDQSTGGQISEGAALIPPLLTPNSSVTNRALGLLATSTTGPTAFGVKLINTSGTILTNINLHYLAELWRQQPGANPLNFGYMVDAAGTNSVFNPSNSAVVWLPGLTANFAPNTFTILDGTQLTNQISVDTNNMQITGWSNTAALWLVWEQTNSAGSHQGIAIDNLQFSATNGIVATAKPVVTASGSAVPSGAFLNGFINPGGLPTSYYFQYSVNANYSGSVYTSTNILGAVPFTLPVNAQLSGLGVNQTYYFQLVASNSLGSATNAGSLSFVTPAPPAVGILGATKIDQLDATLNGWVNPSNGPTSYYFNYGTTTSYGVSTVPTVLPSTAAVSNAVNLAISAGLTTNTVYHYQLVAYNGVGGTNYSADTNFTTTAGAKPTVSNSGASAITANSAALVGKVTPNGLVTYYYFQYGATANSGIYTPTNALAASTSSSTVTYTNTGLSPLTTNHYNLFAYNLAGSASTADSNYVTLPLPPTAVTQPASAITVSNAQLNASVNPSGATNRFWFQYGLSSSYGSVSQTNGVVAGSSAVPVASLSPTLLPGTAYHYQVITVNAGGFSAGGDVLFYTPVIPQATYAGGVFSYVFSGTPGLNYTVYATNDLTIPRPWPVVGQAVETPANSGNYQFTNSSPDSPQEFYILSHP